MDTYLFYVKVRNEGPLCAEQCTYKNLSLTKSQYVVPFERRMVPIVILMFVLLANPGEAFFRPRPQLVELSEYQGLMSALKSMFGFEKSQDETTKIHDQLALKRIQRKLKCAAYAKAYGIPWMEEICLNSVMLNPTPWQSIAPKINRNAYDYGFYN